MAAYFPRGVKRFQSIKKKFQHDLVGVTTNGAQGIVFVTNQELTHRERNEVRKAAKATPVELFHLERITAILDSPPMAGIREQFLGIRADESDMAAGMDGIRDELLRSRRHLESLQTGGDGFCYWMLYHFDMDGSFARDFVIIRKGDYPLYDVRLRIMDMDAGRDVLERPLGEMNAPADVLRLTWPLPDHAYYRVFFHAKMEAGIRISS